MSKTMNCKTIICKVNGITLLDLKNLNNNTNYETIKTKSDPKSPDSSPQQMLEEDNDDNMAEDDNEEDYDDNIEDNVVEMDGNETSDNESAESGIVGGTVITRNTRMTPSLLRKGIYQMEKVETSIESVRQYIRTSRRDGKVWHQCHWNQHQKNGQRSSCNYGSKWSGAMVNHIRSHLGLKPFRCLYCNKLFTIACNLKNHLRIHHGLKAKIVLNGGRRVRQLSTPINGINNSFGSQSSGVKEEEEDEEEEQKQEVEVEVKSSDTSKLRIFKPSFVNGKGNNTPYMERRTLPKRTVKKNMKYVDYEEDFEEEEERVAQNQYNEEEAEEENRKFYANTVEEEEEDYLDDDASRFVVKRRYNKRLWYVCIWNPRQCKYRSALVNEVINHVKKHQNIRQLICNWNHCSASFATRQQLDSHQLIHKKQKFFKCNFANCEFQTINETALQMHKIRHKRQM